MPISTTAPFTALEVLNWSPSDWQIRLPPELSYLVERIGAGVVQVPVYATAGARNTALTAPAAGDLVFLTDGGSATPALQVYDGDSWEVVWPASGGGGGVSPAAVNLNLGDTLAAGTSNIHAPYGASEGDNNFPGPFSVVDTEFTANKTARRIVVSYGAGWDGGAVTLTGTDGDGDPLIEVIPAGDGTDITSVGFFATVPAASKAAVGVAVASASIGTAAAMKVAPPAGLAFDADNIAATGAGLAFGSASLAYFPYTHATTSLAYVGGSARDNLVMSLNCIPA